MYTLSGICACIVHCICILFCIVHVVVYSVHVLNVMCMYLVCVCIFYIVYLTSYAFVFCIMYVSHMCFYLVCICMLYRIYDLVCICVCNVSWFHISCMCTFLCDCLLCECINLVTYDAPFKMSQKWPKLSATKKTLELVIGNVNLLLSSFLYRWTKALISLPFTSRWQSWGARLV